MVIETDEKSENGNASFDDKNTKDPDVTTDEETQLEKVPYPKSVFFIISNEFCERFSYYGMRTILSLYLRDILLFTESDSKVIYHVFTMLAYFFPLLGAIISDSWLGKFRTILYVSIFYAAGNILLALSSAEPIGIPQVPFSLVALFLIAVGTGGIKPCVSAFGGDQFVLPQQEQQLVAFFSVFYFSINAGSLISTFLTPVLREDVHCFGEETCFSLAFAVPGILMIISVVIFFLGMPLYKIRKPEGNVIVQVAKCIWYGAKNNYKSDKKVDHWLDHSVDRFGTILVEDIKIALKVMVIFVPLPIFWALYDQQGSGWTFQATRMDGRLGSWTILPDQMQVINPLLILAFIPLFTYGVYPFLGKFNILTTPLQRMACGTFLIALAFGISAGLSAAVEATYPDLPTDGSFQLRIYNPCTGSGSGVFTLTGPGSVDLTESIDNMGYKFVNVDVSGKNNFTYSFKSNCVPINDNTTGTVELSEGNGYFVYQSNNGLFILEDDISKPEDGYPKVRTLVSNPKISANLTYWDDDEAALTITSANSTLQTIDPGTYKFGNNEVEFLLGGVYTVLTTINEAEPQNSKVFVITEPNSVHVLWQIPQYIIITAGEILFSITGLEFSYSQAPVSMKSVMTAAFLLTSAVGNLIIVIIESIQIFEKQSLDFTLYTGLMVLDMIIFAFMANKYEYVKKNNDEAIEPTNRERKISNKSGKSERY